MPNPWSRQEVDSIIEDYFSMLFLELDGLSYNKTEHRRLLAEALNGRSDSSIESKHQNISAVLIQLDCPYISGYKPLKHFQRLLMDGVSDMIREPGVKERLSAAVSAIVAPSSRKLQLVPTPVRIERTAYQVNSRRPSRYPSGFPNYLEQEARNIALGAAGEIAALDFERARLQEAGRDVLARNIEHTAVTEGPGAGYDVRSYESDGTDRFIEVKTTASGAYTPFFVSAHELQTSARHQRIYHLYRVYQFRTNPQFFVLKGRLEHSCKIEPVQYRAKL